MAYPPAADFFLLWPWGRTRKENSFMKGTMPFWSELRPRSCGFIVTLFGLAALLPMTCRAQGFPPLAPEDLKMTSEPKAPGAPAIILYREVDRDDRHETVHENTYYRIKILTEEGRKYGDIEIPFVKDDDVKNVRARTIRPDGSAIDFDGKIIEQSLVKARGLKVLAKTFNLPAVEPGCVVEYSYTLDLNHAYASQWIVSEELFTRTARFSLKPYQGHGFNSVALRQAWQNLPPGIQPIVAKDGSVSMEVSNIPAFQVEDFMPPPNQMKSRVDFDYEVGRPATDPDSFWKNVGKARDAEMEDFVAKHKAIDAAIAQVISPNDTPELKLRKIYTRVQQIRNTSFEVQKTIQEEKRDKEKVEESVDDVWTRGYGNTWQLDWLFLALARAAGFEAHGCWISSRAEYFFTPKTMQSGHLNEPAVLVQLDGKDLYFNPGAAFAPFGMLNWSETGTAAMRLEKDGGTWMKTTVPKSSESRMERVANLRLTEAGNLEGQLKVTYTGLEAMYHRQNLRNADDVTRKKSLEDQVKHQIPLAAEVDLINKPDWGNPETPLVAEFKLTIPDWATSAGKRMFMPSGLFVAIEKRLFEHTNRIHPIYIEYPYEKDDDVTVKLPEGWQVNSVPPPQARDGQVLTYALKVDKNGTTLRMTRKLTWDFLLLDAKYYPALREFFQSVRSGDDQQIVMEPPAASASN